MMASALISALGGGALSALFYLSVLSGSVGALVLAYLAVLPLFLVGLSLGPLAGLVAGGVASALVMVGTEDMAAAATHIVSCALPSVLVVRQALLARRTPGGTVEWYPPGPLVMELTGYGILGVLGAALLALDAPGGLKGEVQDFLVGGFETLFRAAGPDNGFDPRTMASGIAPVFPAMVVISWLVMTVVNAALAQGVLMRFGRNRRPPMSMAHLELPHWAPMALAAAGAVAMVAEGNLGFVVTNLAMILLVPFFFAGLAVAHAFARGRRGSVAIVLSVYLFMFLFGWPVALVVGLGVAEHWMGLRRRFADAGPRQED
ncbi:MAG TPA: DUF2232 domain-containing protein [Azospirillaceae bacterium]|nr:DUF2232 domain-containing protein [Azospirillaceae bacterium]